MSKPADGVMDDESVHLFKRALYVEPLNYPLDPHKFPADGHEYIHRVRIEDEKVFPGHKQFYESIPAFEIKISTVDDEKKKLTFSEWIKKVANFFFEIANKLKANRTRLMEKFPSRRLPSVENEKEFCLFALGSDLYLKIFPYDKVGKTVGHPPVLSIVLHFSQDEVFTLLQYMTVWVMQTDFDHAVCIWIYALLACLEKPLSDECEEFLENFYDFCKSRTKDCDQNEKDRIYMLSSILVNNFCVKTYTLGPLLDRFRY